MWLTPCMFLGHLKKTWPLLPFSFVWATSLSTLCSPHSSHMMRGSPVCLPSGYSPTLSGSCGCLLRVDELARRDMVARVGEGNGGAAATKDRETKEEEEVQREPLGLSRWEETALVKQYTAGAEWSFAFGLRASTARSQAGWLIWHATSAKMAKY